MPVDSPTSKMIVIDTDAYAGNFEREMCAFVTGRFGECGHARDVAERASREIRHAGWWEEHVVMEADGHDCHRPVSIWPTPGWFNNGFGRHYPDDPANYAEATVAAVEDARKHYARTEVTIRDRMDRGDFEPEGRPGAWTEKACRDTISANERAVREIAEKGRRHPAYLSVAIFVDEFPPEEVMEELDRRVRHFCRTYGTIKPVPDGDTIGFTGTRLVEPVYEPGAAAKP